LGRLVGSVGYDDLVEVRSMIRDIIGH
jgi:hypothetical protein